MAEAGTGLGLRRGFVSLEVAGLAEKRLAVAVVAVSIAAALAGLPFVRVRLPVLPGFIPSYEAALWATDTITAVLLYGQFARLKSGALLVLASGYLFDGLMVIPHGLSFPGAFSPEGLLGANAQVTPWLYVAWHGGFPLFIAAYTLLSGRPGGTIERVRAAITLSAAATLALALATVLFVLELQDRLPDLMNGDSYDTLVGRDVTPAMWLVSLVALVLLWRFSVPTVLDLWLMVVLVAWLLDIAYSAVLGQHRFDVGFYAGRAYGLMASSFVLGAVLIEMNRLYAKLAEAVALAEQRNTELLRSREDFARVQRFEAVGRLVAGVAHDFNNILTVITGGLDLALGAAGLDEKTRRLLDASLQAAHRGGRMTEQLLTFARRQVLRPELLNPNEVVAAIEGFIAQAAGEAVSVRIELSPTLWPVRVDRTQFETALLNLVLNARDAMAGAGEIAIETGNAAVGPDTVPDLPGGDYVRVSVRDTGSGMTEEVAGRAFDPFFTTKEVGKGSGLGLSQVYGFARGASGQARILSRPGEGTVVELYLPKSGGRVAADPFALAPIRPAIGSETILVVEDDPLVLEVAVNGLADLGYRTRTAKTAEEALKTLRADPAINVLFSDVAMPGGMNGAQLAAEAQRLRPELKVLLTSGYAAAALAEQHGLPETLEILPKPYRRDDLARKLRLVIGGKVG